MAAGDSSFCVSPFTSSTPYFISERRHGVRRRFGLPSWWFCSSATWPGAAHSCPAEVPPSSPQPPPDGFFERPTIGRVSSTVLRAAVIASLAIVVVTAPQRSAGQSPNEKPVIDALNAAFDAEQRADFAALVSLVHPRTQHLFRDLLSARTDILLRSYAQAQISAVSGLATHPKDLMLSDAEFFVITCNNTKARHPEFADESKYLPFTLEGTTFDSGDRAHVVLSAPASIRTERTDFSFLVSQHVFLKHEKRQWLLWSVPFARSIGDFWSRDLAMASSPTMK